MPHPRAGDIAVSGLAVMGQNLVLNLERNGYHVVVHNRTTSKMTDFVANHDGKNLIPAVTLEEMVANLARPRRVLLMVQAGRPVDAVLDALVPLLDEGDIVMDGGNSYFPDTERRSQALTAKGLVYMGVGVSGGEEGALWGPSIIARRGSGGVGSGRPDAEGDLRQSGRGRRAMCQLHRERGRGPLCQDGAQRHRIWGHAAYCRGV